MVLVWAGCFFGAFATVAACDDLDTTGTGTFQFDASTNGFEASSPSTTDATTGPGDGQASTTEDASGADDDASKADGDAATGTDAGSLLDAGKIIDAAWLDACADAAVIQVGQNQQLQIVCLDAVPVVQ